MNAAYADFGMTDDDGELPRATSCTCQWCGKPLPPFLRAKHEDNCERSNAVAWNTFEAIWLQVKEQAKRMAEGQS